MSHWTSGHRPHRNPMPPPKLAADAPVLNVRQPVVRKPPPAVCGWKCIPPGSVELQLRVIPSYIAQAGALRSSSCLHASFGFLELDIKNHCSLKRGSIGTPGAFAETNVVFVRLSSTSAPSSVSFSTATLRAFETIQPFKSAPARSFIVAVGNS